VNDSTTKLKKMFEMQEALNIYTNGPDYKETKICAKTGKRINYRRCAWMETAEFVGSFDWKHWKHGKDDIENAKTELVDIWHFLMSAELVEHGIPDNGVLNLATFVFHSSIKNVKADTSTLDIAEEFVRYSTDVRNEIFPNIGQNGILLNLFCQLCAKMELSFDELYQRYIIKNTLNKFRQDNGYAEGTYIKMWAAGREDNVFAVMFAERLSADLSAEKLYSVLERCYKTIVSATDVFGGLTIEQAEAIETNIGFKTILLTDPTNLICGGTPTDEQKAMYGALFEYAKELYPDEKSAQEAYEKLMER